jgi:hypothetical protein
MKGMVSPFWFVLETDLLQNIMDESFSELMDIFNLFSYTL